MKVMFAEIAAMITKKGFLNAIGGVVPMTRSRMMPPPVAVKRARILTPKISIFFLIPAMAPDTAKATVPMMSVIKMKSPVSIGVIIYVFDRNICPFIIIIFDSFIHSK